MRCTLQLILTPFIERSIVLHKAHRLQMVFSDILIVECFRLEKCPRRINSKPASPPHLTSSEKSFYGVGLVPSDNSFFFSAAMSNVNLAGSVNKCRCPIWWTSVNDIDLSVYRGFIFMPLFSRNEHRVAARVALFLFISKETGFTGLMLISTACPSSAYCTVPRFRESAFTISRTAAKGLGSDANTCRSSHLWWN